MPLSTLALSFGIAMAHRALTLKYRPQTFSDMIGQEHVSLVLGRALESGRIAHAYLFTGARGVGKTTAARLLAKALDCANRGTGSEPCNACSSCLEITNGTSLDVAEIDGASNRGIADVQALREKVRFTPTGGKYRIVIIDEVHQLSGDAFAALLKTLEEPPPHLVFIFATTDPQKLPDTIRSRTQRFDFSRVPLRKVADRLLDIRKREAADPEGVDFTLGEGAALLIAHKGEGSMRDAVSALDQVVSTGESDISEELVRRVLGIADKEAFFAIAEAIVKRDPKGALHALHAAFEKGLDARDLAEGLSEHIRHILILKVDPEAKDLVALAAEDVKRLRAQGEGWAEQDLLRLLKLASEAPWPMRDSPQPLIHLEAAVLQMATLEPGETLAQILDRLESLERKLGGAPAIAPSAPGARSAAGGGGVGRGVASPSPAPAAPPFRAAVNVTTMPQAPRSAAAPPRAAYGTAPASGSGGAPGAAAGAAGGARAARRAGGWRAAVKGVNERKRMLGAFLEESRFVGVAADRLVVAMDDVHRAVVEDKENRALVADEARRAFGRPLELQCAPLGADEIRRPKAREDVIPMVDQAIAWFEGEAIERNDRRGERTDG